MALLNSFEWTNIVVATGLLAFLFRKRDAATLLLILFVYGTFHFGFSVLAFTQPESTKLLVAFHTQGTGALASAATLLLLGVIFVALTLSAYQGFNNSDAKDRTIVTKIALMMIAVMVGYGLNYRQSDWLQLKNVVSIQALLYLLLVGYFSSIFSNTVNVTRVYKLGVAELFVFFVIDLIAVYEVLSLKAWASFQESSGDVIYRASSVFFNPNLLGLWASFVYLWCGYGVYAYKSHRKTMLWGMVLSSIALYMSGSRSSAYMLFVVLLIPTLSLSGRARWMILWIFPATILTIYSIGKLLSLQFAFYGESWSQLTLLGERFLTAPLYLVNYLLLKLGLMPYIYGVPIEVSTAIEGRLSGDGSDGGWILLYQDAGWLGVAAMVWGCSMLIFMGIRTHLVRRGPESAYSLAILVLCLLTGLVMRFQVFPVWMFLSLLLIPCLCYWRTPYIQKLLSDNNKCAP